jgi:RNA polymerase sigma factor (sigma-70 family)
MDAALVRQARAGSQAAFARLVAIHEKPLRGFLRKSGWIDADDIAQEAFVAAWVGLSKLRDDDGFRAWLYGVAWRKALSQRRGAQRAAARDEAWRGEQDLETASKVAPEDRMALETALAALPEDQRACVTLCLGQGWSHAEASDALGLPLGTVKSHVTRGRERLLAVMGGSR